MVWVGNMPKDEALELARRALWTLRTAICWCPCGPTELGYHDRACLQAQLAWEAIENAQHS